MEILYYENGDILAVGDIVENNGTFEVSNDMNDVAEYSLKNLAFNAICIELTIQLPEDFKKYNYKYLNDEFIAKEITGIE